MDAERKRHSMANSHFIGIQKAAMPKPAAKKASSTKAQDATKQLAAMLSMRRQVPAAKQQGILRRASAAVGDRDRTPLDRRASSSTAEQAREAVSISPKPLRGGQRRVTLPATIVMPEQQEESALPVTRFSTSGGEARAALDHCLSYWSASDSLLLLMAVVRAWHHLILIQRQGILCRNSRAQTVLDASFAYWCTNEDLLLLSRGMQAWLYVLLHVEKQKRAGQGCMATRAAALYEICFHSWGASTDALTLTVAMQAWKDCVALGRIQRRSDDKERAVAILERCCIDWSSSVDALLLERVVHAWECFRVRKKHELHAATKRSGEKLLLQMHIMRTWRDSVLYRHTDEVVSKRIHGFQLCAVVFLAWSDDAREGRKLSEQVSRNSFFLESFAEEQSSLHSLRDRLDGFRQDLLSRERDIRERELDVRTIVQRTNAERDAANERMELESKQAQTAESSYIHAMQELSVASTALASVRDENNSLLEKSNGLAQSLAVAEAAASRDALLVVGLREELQAVWKKLEIEASSAVSDRQALTLQLKKTQSDLQVVRDQAGSQGSSFMHLAAQNATLEEQMQELRQAEAGRAEVITEARAELQAEVVRLQHSEEELAKRRREFDLHVEDREHRNTVTVQAVCDQAEHQNKEYLRLFEASEEQQKEIARLRSEEESTQTLKRELELLKASLDQREFDLGREELQLNLRKRRTAVMVEQGLHDSYPEEDEQKTVLEGDAEQSPTRRRCMGGDQAVD